MLTVKQLKEKLSAMNDSDIISIQLGRNYLEEVCRVRLYIDTILVYTFEPPNDPETIELDKKLNSK